MWLGNGLEIKISSALPVTVRMRLSECFHSKDFYCTAAEWVVKPSYIVHCKMIVVQKITAVL